MNGVCPIMYHIHYNITHITCLFPSFLPCLLILSLFGWVTTALYLSTSSCFRNNDDNKKQSWYASALPFLLLAHVKPPQSVTSLLQTILLRLLMPMAAMEMSFLTFPATATSSAVLQVVHAVTLCLALHPIDPITTTDVVTKDVTKIKKR